jgi:hypothetical protein
VPSLGIHVDQRGHAPIHFVFIRSTFDWLRSRLFDAAGVWGDRRSTIRRHGSTTYGDSKMLHSGRSTPDRRAFIGGSDARIIMGDDGRPSPMAGKAARSTRGLPRTT